MYGDVMIFWADMPLVWHAGTLKTGLHHTESHYLLDSTTVVVDGFI